MKPLQDLAAGRELEVTVLGAHVAAHGGHRTRNLPELSARPSAIEVARAGGVPTSAAAFDTLEPGQWLVGAVQQVANDHLFVALSAAVRGRVHLLHARDAPAAQPRLQQHFKPGQLLRARVLAVDIAAQRLDLSLLDDAFAPVATGGDAPPAGARVMAQVKSVSGACVVCHLADGTTATAPLTSLHDAFVANALDGLTAGAVVRGAIAPGGADDKGRLPLSLQQRDGGAHAGHEQPVDGPETPRPGTALQLAKGDLVHGYVRSAQPPGKGAGVFVALSSGQDARVQLRMLSDDFVDDPVATFPPGKYVRGHVIEVKGGRLELSLKSQQGGAGPWQTLSSLEVGQVRPPSP